MQSLYPPEYDYYQRIYSGQQLDYYDALIRCHDAEGNLLKTLREIVSMEGKTLLDLGAGTGRISRLAASHARQVVGTDLNLPILRMAQKYQRTISRWQLALADIAHLPLKSGGADICVVGWVLGDFTRWFADWGLLIEETLAEMQRVTAHGGALIIIESMGVGTDKPNPPNQPLAEYYAFLEEQCRFSREVIRTDYLFPNVALAVNLINFYYGEVLAQQVQEAHSSRITDWTGIWYRYY